MESCFHTILFFLSLNVLLRFLLKFVVLSIIAAPEFATGKTYVYKYEAFLMGGLPEEGLARAGVKVKSKVFISAAAADILMLKVKLIHKCSTIFY